ncbi:MAG: thioredoxin [Clostridia bacterium]|nr:thioredoxin [Clostridia bacterium]
MNKKKKLVVEILLFIVLLIGINVMYYNLVRKDTKQSIQEENTLKSAESKENIEITEIKSLEQFEKEVINESKTVFIDFYATWCMPCRKMTPIIEEIAKEHKEVKFVKIDIDKNEELALKYNVMSIPTMLVMKNGEVKKTFVGIINKESIVKEFKYDI